MAIFVVSDVHGAAESLSRAVPAGGTLILLGDLINFIDYLSMTGILVDVFSEEAVSSVVRLRTEGRLEEAREAMRTRAEGREDEIQQEIGRRVREQYSAVFDAMPQGTYMILGNVDNPALAHSYAEAHGGVHECNGRTFEIEGQRFGFIGGALPTPLHVAGEVTEEEMAASIGALGEVDVLCSHIPPAVPELCFDTVARKSERGSEDLLEFLHDVKPARHYFGHVHQPLVSSMYVGETLCINVGYFRKTARAFPHDLDYARLDNH